MNFDLTDEQKMIRDTVRDFAEKNLKPMAGTYDKEKHFPLENLKKMADLGLMGMNVPAQYGGSEVGVVAYSLAMTEVGRGCASTACTMSVTNMVGEMLLEFGTPAIAEKHVPRICNGEYPAGSFALTESSAGSDAAALQTAAYLDGDSYVLNGRKVFITSGRHSGVTVIWAVTDKKAKKGKGISAFVVEKETRGFIVGKGEEKLGQRASSTDEIILENCRVPRENLLGKEGEGFVIAMKELDGGRIGVGSMAVGIGLAAIDYARDYAREREQFGKPISSFQAIQWMIADSYTELAAARLLMLRAAFLKENGRKFTREASMGKLFATETAKMVVLKAMQILGGYGYTTDYPLERLLRDVVVTTIYEGTSEIQRLVVSRDILEQRQSPEQ